MQRVCGYGLDAAGSFGARGVAEIYGTACRYCGAALEEILDFGQVALAGAFLKPDQFNGEKRYPLCLCRCERCLAVQLADRVNPETMFRNYFYLSSATSSVRDHFKTTAEMLIRRFKPKTVFEIGSNDGVLLRHFVGHADIVVGIEPANVPNLAEGASMMRDFWAPKTASELVDDLGNADLIVANNVFAHIPQINEATEAVRFALKDHGVFVFETHHLGALIKGVQYDWIYHEHLYYHSLIALDKHLENHGLRVFDVEPVALHGGSMRFYVCKDERAASPAVAELRAEELRQGLDRMETFRRFAVAVLDHRRALYELVVRLHRERKKIVGYGASGRANALMQFCGIGECIEYMVDDAPAKHGHYTPGTHLEIRPKIGETDYVLVFAWNYAEEILPKCAGHRVIVPLPIPHIRQERLAA